MDFKNYVRMMLEADKAKDQDEEKAESQDDSDEEEDEEEDEDEDEQASVNTNKNGCTGSEASCNTNKGGCKGSKASCDTDDDDDDDDDEDDEDDDDDDKCPDCGKSPCECKKNKSLKESMIYSSNYLNGKTNNTLTEEVKILTEDIKNNSASKYLAKLAKKAEKEAVKYEKKGVKEAAQISKKSASALKEASNKLYKCEIRYKAGDVMAKKEYKKICKQYSSELKNLGRTARGFKGLLFTLLAGTLALGAIGTTVVANADADGGFSSKIEDAIGKFKQGKQSEGLSILKDIGENDKNFIKSVISGEKFEGSSLKADMEAREYNWKDAAIKKVKQIYNDSKEGFKNAYKKG